MVEESVKDDFRVERCQILKIPEGDGLCAAGVNGRQVGANVVVIALKVIAGDFELAAAGNNAVVNMTAPMRIKAFLSALHILQQLAVFFVT